MKTFRMNQITVDRSFLSPRANLESKIGAAKPRCVRSRPTDERSRSGGGATENARRESRARRKNPRSEERGVNLLLRC
jgi:hypothetical protein